MTTKTVECVSTGTRLPESVAKEVDDLFKTLPSDCTYRTKAIAADAINFEPGERSEVSILTTNSVDWSNEVVLPEGVDMDAYRKSMVVLWNHDNDKPIGSCEWIKNHKNSIRAKTVYPADGTELSNQTWIMTKCTPPVLKAKSIGFLPRKPLRDATEDELTEHPEWKGAGVWDDVLLLEYSVVPLGCNKDALIEMVNTKSINGAILKSLGMEVPEVKQIEAPEIEVKQTVEEVAQAVMKSGLSLQDAIAYVQKNSHKKVVKKKPVDVNKILADALAGVNLDVDRIVRRALDAHKNRGRV
jgi:hypothetical protein